MTRINLGPIVGPPGTTNFNELENVPSTFPSTIPLVDGLQTELNTIRNLIPDGDGCDCPELTWENIDNVPSTFPPTAHSHDLNQIDWQNGNINGHVLWTGGNVGLNFGTPPDAAGIQECGIQARSTMTSMLLRGSGRLDSLNRAFFFRPNSANGPQDSDAILRNDGQFSALTFAEGVFPNAIPLEQKYTPRLPDNAFDANVPITSYPNGRSIHFHSQAPTQSGFPYGTTMIETNQFHNTGIQYATNLVTGARSRRIWSGISWQGWNVEPTMSILEKLCEKLDVDINEIMEVE